MPPDSTPRVSTHQTWALALALATFGTCVLWNTTLGINWGLCVALVAAALLVVARRRHGRAGAPAAVACAWAIALAVGAAVTTDGRLLALILLTSLALLAIALVTAGQRSLAVLRPHVALSAPFLALLAVITGLSSEVAGAARATRARGISAAFRSVVITLPVILALVLLLGDADPLFAAMRDEIEHVLPFDDPMRFLFFAILLVVALGAFGSVAHGEGTTGAAPASTVVPIGRLENRVLMSAVAVVMWMFVISATASLRLDPAARAGSGVTYAVYARSGFAQLSLAATLVIGAVLATRREWIPTDHWTRRLAASALAGVAAMLVIAFVRVIRYEQAYGYTVARLEAQGYMIVLAIALALVVVEIVRRAPFATFAYRSATGALVVFAIFVFWNTDAWIVRRNVDRYQTTGTIDLGYLMRLSADATPALLESLPRLREPERAVVSRWVETHERAAARQDPWFAWNRREAQSAAALSAFAANNLPSASPPR